MWVVFKYKSKEYELVKQNFKKKVSNNINFYNPKIKYFRNINNNLKAKEKYILENYAFCYLENFKDTAYLNKFKNIKGLSYFLTGCVYEQNQILKFINLCIANEKDDGTLSSDFFTRLVSKKAKFLNGPFSNMVFDILKREKNKLKILLGNVVTIVEKKSNILYLPV